MRTSAITAPRRSPTPGDRTSPTDPLGGLSHHPLLTAQKEHDLAVRARAGDKTARHQLTEHNFRLVQFLARRYLRAGIELDDLIQEGNEGLLIAVAKFDPAYGTRLSTYAAPWIHQRLQRYVAAQGRPVRLPAEKQHVARRLDHATTGLQEQLSRRPTLEERAKAVGLAPRTVADLDRARSSVSLSTIVGDDGETTLAEFVAAPDAVEADTEQAELADILATALDMLTPRERDIFVRYHGILGRPSESFAEIAASYGVAAERIRQIHQKVFKKMPLLCGCRLHGYVSTLRPAREAARRRAAHASPSTHPSLADALITRFAVRGPAHKITRRALALLDHLEAAERQVLRMRYGTGGALGASPSETARHLVLSPERVRRLEQGALAKLARLLTRCLPATGCGVGATR